MNGRRRRARAGPRRGRGRGPEQTRRRQARDAAHSRRPAALSSRRRSGGCHGNGAVTQRARPADRGPGGARSPARPGPAAGPRSPAAARGSRFQRRGAGRRPRGRGKAGAEGQPGGAKEKDVSSGRRRSMWLRRGQSVRCVCFCSRGPGAGPAGKGDGKKGVLAGGPDSGPLKMPPKDTLPHPPGPSPRSPGSLHRDRQTFPGREAWG